MSGDSVLRLIGSRNKCRFTRVVRGKHLILKFVELGMTVGSTTGFVSVLIPLELDPDIYVGVRGKIFPLRCRGSVPSGVRGAFSARVPDSSVGGVPVGYCPDDGHMEEEVQLEVQVEEERTGEKHGEEQSEEQRVKEQTTAQRG